jgi:hypothetical protein
MNRNHRALTVGPLLIASWAAPPAVALAHSEPNIVEIDEVEADNDSAGYTPGVDGPGGQSPLQTMGYVDVGYANAQGNGTSFAPGDTRLPADYGVDTFAPAVNSRGDVASTDSGGLFTNGFLPRSVGIGGRGSFLINTVNFDFKYSAPGAPVMVFTRLQLLPRFTGAGDETRPVLEQAFGRIIPFDSQELAVTIGKFDSVFGIEYIENPSNIRTGITPSLWARYTTGTSIGAKVFYRQQIAPLWSAISLNVAATNHGNFVEALQPPDASLTGRPVMSARLGYELNLPVVQVKVGGSALDGPRNDQNQADARQKILGVDLRVALLGFFLNGEYVHVEETEGGPKTTGAGNFPVSSRFRANGFYGQLAYTAAVDFGPLRRVTVYGRYEQRHAAFFTPITVDRITGGVRTELWEMLILKGEYLRNREREGAPNVSNDVLTTSLVYTW